MTKLSVNVNKIATLRNARGKNLPDVIKVSRNVLDYGAHGITVHPRPDQRHIRFEDVVQLRAMINEWNGQKGEARELNVESYPSAEFFELVKKTKPEQCTLVPDPPEVLTSNAGWQVARHFQQLKDAISHLRGIGARVSLFVDPLSFTDEDRSYLTRLKPDRIELYTESFAHHFATVQESKTLESFVSLAIYAREAEIQINAGHDLNQKNLPLLLKKIPFLAEVSIGHALICEALEEGLKNTIAKYLRILKSV